jgi:hypothetical protein
MIRRLTVADACCCWAATPRRRGLLLTQLPVVLLDKIAEAALRGTSAERDRA